MGKTMYKGFDKDLKCLGFQYEEGKEYIHEGTVEVCKGGFHACEKPFDVFAYYPPNDFHRFCVVEGSGKEAVAKNKTSFEKLKIKAELGLNEFIKAGVQFCLDRVKWTNRASAAGDYSGASATDGCSGASATGDFSGASVTGYMSGASVTGDYSGASAAGNHSEASATGDYSGASVTGNYSGASVTGNFSGASATGDFSGASVTGKFSRASVTGNYSGASATGDFSGASATGDYSGASAAGYKSEASATGYMSEASATGNCSGASATGYKSGASAGKGSVALSIGRDARAKGSIGSWLVLTQCHYDVTVKEDFIDLVKVAKVDGKRIKADTWYTLKEGKFVLADISEYE